MNPNIPDLAPYESALLQERTTIINFILQSKENIWHNSDLLDLVKGYFGSSSKILAFYSALDIRIKKIRNSHFFIQRAIARLDEGRTEPGDRFSGTVRELDSFKSAGDPFTDEFVFAIFRSVYDPELSMLSKLRAEREKLVQKLKGLRLKAHLGTVGKWIISLWKRYESGVKKELDFVLEMEIETFTAVIELQNIQKLVENLKVEIERMLFNARVAVEQDDEVVVSLAIDEIKKNLAVFMQPVDVLAEQSYKYSRNIEKAREVILQRMMNY